MHGARQGLGGDLAHPSECSGLFSPKSDEMHGCLFTWPICIKLLLCSKGTPSSPGACLSIGKWRSTCQPLKIVFSAEGSDEALESFSKAKAGKSLGRKQRSWEELEKQCGLQEQSAGLTASEHLASRLPV